MEAHFEKIPYVDSPLATILVSLLDKIAELKTKYATAPKKTINQLKALEAIIKAFNEIILPKFDNKAPDYSDLIDIYKAVKTIVPPTNPFKRLATPKLILLKGSLDLLYQETLGAEDVKISQINKKTIVDCLNDAIVKQEIVGRAQDYPYGKKANFNLTKSALGSELQSIKNELTTLDLSSFFLEDELHLTSLVAFGLDLISRLFTYPKKGADFNQDRAVFNAVHPLFFELILHLAELFQNNLPESLDKLIPFIKLDKIFEFLSSLKENSRYLPSISSLETLLKILEHFSSIKGKADFSCQVTYSSVNTTLDLSALYKSDRNLPKDILIPVLVSFVKQNPLVPELGELISKSTLLQKCFEEALTSTSFLRLNIKTELEDYISSKIQEYKLENEQVLAPDLKGLDRIKALSSQIQNTNTLLKSKVLHNEFKYRYDNLKLSDEEVAWNQDLHCVEVIPYQAAINTFIEEQLTALTTHYKEQKAQLVLARQFAVQEWSQALFNEYTDTFESYKTKLAVIEEETSMGAREEVKELDLKIEQLSHNIEAIEDKIKTLNTFNQNYDHWSQHYVANLSNQSDIADDKSLTLEVANLAKTIEQDRKLFAQQIKDSLVKANRQLEQAHRDKAKTLFEKEMRCANPEKMKEMLESKKVEIKTLVDAINDLEIEVANSKVALTETNKAITKLKESSDTKTRLIAGLENDNNNYINRANELLIEHRISVKAPSLRDEDLLTEENLIENIDLEREYLTQFSFQVSNKLSGSTIYKEHLTFLEEAKNSLTACPNKIPFQKIDELKPDNGGFRTLLVLIELEDKAMDWGKYHNAYNRFVGNFSWDDFRKCQDDTFTLYKIAEIKALLIKKVNTMIHLLEEKYEESLNNQMLLLAMENTSYELKCIKNNFVYKKTERIPQLGAEVMGLESDKKVLTTKAQRQEDEISIQTLRLEDLKKAQKEQENNVKCLALIIAILEAITRHEKLIDSFVDETALFDLNPLIKSLQQSINQLRKDISEFDASAAKDLYQVQRDNVKRVLERFDERLFKEFVRNYKSTCQEKHAMLTDSLNTLNQDSIELKQDQDLSCEDRIIKIDVLLEQYKQLSTSMAQYHDFLKNGCEFVKNNVNKVLYTENTSFENEALAKESLTLAEKIKTVGSELQVYMDNQHYFQIMTSFILSSQQSMESLQAKAKIFDKEHELSPESETLFAENQNELAKLFLTLKQLPSYQLLIRNPEPLLDDSNRVILTNQINTLEEIRQNAIEAYEGSVEINQKIEIRIRERGELASWWASKLDGYLEARNLEFWLKDSFTSVDQEDRMDLITHLQAELLRYKESGDSKALLRLIRRQQKDLPKAKLSRLLGQLLLAIIDEDRKIPASYTLELGEDYPEDIQAFLAEFEPLYAEVEMLSEDEEKRVVTSFVHKEENDESVFGQIRKQMETTPRATLLKHLESMYFETMGVEHGSLVNKPVVNNANLNQGLLEALQRLEELGEEDDKDIITALTQKLREDLEYFSNSNPSEEDKAIFLQDFTTRLHSQDEVLSQHKETFDKVAEILVNIAWVLLGVLTAGVSVGAKLTHSKVTTGVFSFFIPLKTDRQAQIASVEESAIQTIAPPVA